MVVVVAHLMEIQHACSRQSFWLFLDGEKLLLPFEQFPWFKEATIKRLTKAQWPTPSHLY